SEPDARPPPDRLLRECKSDFLFCAHRCQCVPRLASITLRLLTALMVVGLRLPRSMAASRFTPSNAEPPHPPDVGPSQRRLHKSKYKRETQLVELRKAPVRNTPLQRRVPKQRKDASQVELDQRKRPEP